MTHPDWYYLRYDDVFSRGHSYFAEVNLVNSCFAIRDKAVVEIGAGTGNHSDCILRFEPHSLILFDTDPAAAILLKDKFRDEPVVTIHNEDGFVFERPLQCDLVLAFFSVIVLGITDAEEFTKRVAGALSLLRNRGCLSFEYVDYDVSREVYPDGEENTLYERDQDIIRVSTRYFSQKLVVRYRGSLGGSQVEYDAELLRVTTSQIRDLLVRQGLRNPKFLPLDAHGRRNLCVVSGVLAKT